MSKIRKLEQLTDTELAVVAKVKNSKGIATAEAKRAQRILWDRVHISEADLRIKAEKERMDWDES